MSILPLHSIPARIGFRSDANLSACSLTDAGFEPIAATPVDEPLGAVMAMARAQSCIATEGEIFDAITNAGFGHWHANQFIAFGAENGTLLPLDRPNGGEHRYRLAVGSADEDALTVDPNATELSLISDQIPQPVRKQITEIAAACGPDFQSEGRDQDAFLAEDVNSDGTYGFLLGHVLFCSARSKAMCDESGCPLGEAKLRPPRLPEAKP